MKNRIVTVLIIIATVILAGVAVFTAIRLYQLRGQTVAPTSPAEPYAMDCSKYTFSVDESGKVSVSNQSDKDLPSQQASVYINEILVATLEVPALLIGQTETLGSVNVPQGQTFSWRVVGTKACQNSGTSTSIPTPCKELKFSITAEENTPTITPTTTLTPTLSPTLTPTPTPTPTNSPTPTEPQIGGPISTPTEVPTSTPTTRLSSTPSPTTSHIAQLSPTPGGETLPDAGVSLPSLILGSLGILLILGALILAL